MTDLEDIGLRVKHMPLLKVAQGYLYKVQGEVRISLKTWILIVPQLLERGDPVAANRFYQMARDSLEDCIESDPQNYEALCTLGEVLCQLVEGETHTPANIRFSIENPLIAKAQEYYTR